MSATLSPPSPRRGSSLLATAESHVTPNERILLHDVSWTEYDTLCDLFAERHIFLTYDQGDLEIRMPSLEHDSPGFLLDAILSYITRYFGVLIVGIGSTTLRRKIKSRGLEPDRAFYLSHAKEVLGKKNLDLSIDPPPDLAIEMDVTSSSIPRMPIYASLGVPEVWRYDGQSLSFHQLQGEDYTETPVSLALPQLTPGLISTWLTLGQAQGIHAVYDAIDGWWKTKQGR
jgi:Uma2 family endonuclease